MRTAVLAEDRPRLEVVDVADPVPGEGEVVLRVTGCGICGSDLHVAKTIGPPGTILGHEVAGVVEEAGRGVDARWRRGTAVVGRPLVGCRECSHCRRGRPDHCDAFTFIGMQRPGGFAEYVTFPADELFAVPAGVAQADQALTEPLAVARHALRRGGLRPGEAVTVLGAGPIGLAVTAWARALGAARIVVSDPLAERRELALAVGADAAVPPAEVPDAGGTSLVVECAGKPGLIDQALQLADVDGRVVVVGICMAPDTIFPWRGLAKEIDVRFAVYYDPADFTETLDALDSARLAAGAMVTETVSLDELPARFLQLADAPDGGKVVLRP